MEEEKQPSVPKGINPNAGRLFNKKKRVLAKPSLLAERIGEKDRLALSQGITLIESKNQEHRALAQELLQACLPRIKPAYRIGITGSPGVGKSTFIESLGLQIVKGGQRVAVLAIDPSSPISKGSILGDKTRMEELSRHPDVFIRPSPTSETLGGVAQKTRETILLCEAAGYDWILVETVGVGQSEIAVHSMTDFFLLLLLPGAGDELQGIKRGIMEMADLIAINKADKERIALAKRSRTAYRNALHLLPPKESDWIPTVHTCSALYKEKMEAIWEDVKSYFDKVEESGFLTENRVNQSITWFEHRIQSEAWQILQGLPGVQKKWSELRVAIKQHKITPFFALQELRQLIEKSTHPS